MSDKPLNTDDELFNDNFGAWLEYHGTDLEAQHTSGRWKAMIDLNKLKAAILQRESTDRKKHELQARLEEYQQGLMVGAVPEFIGKPMAEKRIAELKQELEKL